MVCQCEGAAAARIPPKVLLMKARQIATELVRHMRAEGHFIDLPVLDKHWLLRWKRLSSQSTQAKHEV